MDIFIRDISMTTLDKHRRVSASARHKVTHCDSRAVPYGCIMEQRLNRDLSPN